MDDLGLDVLAIHDGLGLSLHHLPPFLWQFHIWVAWVMCQSISQTQETWTLDPTKSSNHHTWVTWSVNLPVLFALCWGWMVPCLGDAAWIQRPRVRVVIWSKRKRYLHQRKKKAGTTASVEQCILFSGFCFQLDVQWCTQNCVYMITNQRRRGRST